MIKGVNHKVIEVTDTDNIYYEKAWLLVRPQYEEAEEAVLRKEARKLVAEAGNPSSIGGRRTFWYWALRFLPAVCAGIGVGIMLGIFVN